jgi:hypothetical protein
VLLTRDIESIKCFKNEIDERSVDLVLGRLLTIHVLDLATDLSCCDIATSAHPMQLAGACPLNHKRA